jgi:hypothetical protein
LWKEENKFCNGIPYWLLLKSNRASSIYNTHAAVRWLFLWYRSDDLAGLIALNGAINVTNKEQTRFVTHRTEQKEPSVTDDAHVAKKVRTLHETSHVTFEVKVIKRISKDGDCSAPTAQE